MKIDYPMRSLMFVPGHNLKLLNSAIKTNADVLLIDLEDSVQPTSNKQLARNNILQFLNEKKFSKHHLFPRINDRESGELLRGSMEGRTIYWSTPGKKGF